MDDMHHHPKGIHGMLVVGEGTVYLSHLPMFVDPAHQFQVILETALSGGSGDPHADYVADRQHTRATLYTLQPDPMNPFVLTEFAPGHGHQRRSFDGTVFRGHFERLGNEPILGPVTVDVVRVLYFQELPVDGAPLERLEYLLFGAGRDIFLAHVITRPPDFDQVLSVQLTGDGPAEELRRGVRVAVPGRVNAIKERLRSGERVAVEVVGTGAAREIELKVAAEVYFEESELSELGTMEATAEEIAARMPPPQE
jgi:hypothetical protein